MTCTISPGALGLRSVASSRSASDTRRRFREVVAPRSRGFEIETELASEAVAHRMRTVEVPVPYRPRIAGSSSKLQAFRDGLRIMATILRQGLRLRPWRPLALLLSAAGILSLVTGPLTLVFVLLLGLATLVVAHAGPRR